MSIKVGHVSISPIADKYASQKVKDLDTTPPAEILREQESIKKHKDSFAQLYAEQLKKEQELLDRCDGYKGIFEDGKLFEERFPELAAYMKDLGAADPEAFVSAVDQRHYGGWYGESKVYYIEQHWNLDEAELKLENYDYYGITRAYNGYTIMPFLYQRAKGFIAKIDQDKADIESLKARYAQQIKTEANQKVREAMQAVATAESYDLIYDPSEVAMVALKADDVSDKVSAKVA